MAEDSEEDHLHFELDNGDIKTNIYEGGFKTWECAIDLARIVADDTDPPSSTAGRGIHCIELGCGTALPSITLFQSALSSSPPRPIRFTLADYNHSVLRLATIPNLLLSWAKITKCEPLSSAEEDDLDITPALLEDFTSDLERRGTYIDAISGAWSEEFIRLVGASGTPITAYTLVLASETIYSPSTLCPFTELLLALLSRNAAGNSKALIAAKKVYFGVGGGVDEFLEILTSMGGAAQEVVAEDGQGVVRVVLEIA
ncbi:MAG: hypothetical protein M1830_000819 [Pleopsidium flavum]|nr:MAG: hypothetical protein M1830_000819 [Pleopsidium flavum]